MKVYWQGTPGTRPRGVRSWRGHSQEGREFLVWRRAKITPEQANLPVPSSSTTRSGPTCSTWQWTLDAVTEGPAFVRNGRMDLLAAEPGLTFTIYTAEPGSPSEEALRLLASWTSTPEQAPAVSSDSST